MARNTASSISAAAGRRWQAIKPQTAFIVAILRYAAESQPFLDESPAPRGFASGDTEQEAAAISVDVAVLAVYGVHATVIAA